MPRLKNSDIQDRVKSIVNITGSGYDSLVKDAIQWGLDFIGSKWNWPYLMEESFIATVAPYETGTVSVTNASATVTGSGTTFTSGMVGRKIRVNSENAYYRIKTFVSTTELTLEVNYQGSTATGETYSIFKDEYRLPADLDRYKVMRQIEESVAMVGLGTSAFDIAEPTPESEGSPNFTIIAGSLRDTYTTGTVTGSVGSATLTGASTNWTSAEGLGRGSRITIGSNIYTVKSVDSDTQITLFETIITALNGDTYSVLLDNLRIQFFTIPDAAENIYFRYQRIPYVLHNDTDIPDLPDQWHHLLVDAGLMRLWETKDKDEARAKKQEFLIGVEEMKKAIGHIGQHTRYPRKSLADEMRQYPLGPRTTADRGTPFTL
jgi:hypothetical protein